MKQIKEIRTEIDRYINTLNLQNFTFKVKSGSYGHSAGDSIENLIKNILIEGGYEVYFTDEFIEKVFNNIGPNKKVLEKTLNGIWWSKLPLYSKNQEKNFLEGKNIGGYQQAGADIVLFYGNDLKYDPENVILINAKAHNVDRKSRAPNIISAQRLLEFSNELLSNDNMLDNAEYWFIGINHKPIGNNTSKVQSIQIKDLFKINTDKISQINFDAAIQIQTHIKDMEEINQTKKEFIKNLADLFLNEWNKHAHKKQAKYEKLVNEIYENY